MERLAPGLTAWAGDDAARKGRVDALFALSPGARWNEERVLDRYELLYEAGLVEEAARDNGRPVPASPGDLPMASDHRRIRPQASPACAANSNIGPSCST